MLSALLAATTRSRMENDDWTVLISFSGLLRGRRIKSININELGLLSVMTEEITTGRPIELDSLSSGEKNIALTFLLVARSVARGGIVLFDEPELHLNPAVSRDLLPFMMDEYSKPHDIQFIVCTHSPEVLSGAFKDGDCTLLHLKSPNDITRVGKRAIEEYSDALQRLGTSIGETLFYDGTILVEGEDDIAFLDVGFSDILKRYKVKDRGGRREIEKAVIEIQELEKKGEKVAPIFLIFDKDDEPTGLKNSKAVKILQWQRRCVENYMIDIDVIAELLKNPDITNRPISSEGEVYKQLRDLAYQQLDSVAARTVYRSYGYRNASLTREDAEAGSLPLIADALFARMNNCGVNSPDKQKRLDFKFLTEVETEKERLMLTWEAKWQEICDGKKLISDLHKASSLKCQRRRLRSESLERCAIRPLRIGCMQKACLKNF